jgi:uncharacterized protein
VRVAVRLAITALTATLAGTASGAVVRFPDTAAGRQAQWLTGAVTHLPIPAATIDAHFDRAYLAHVPAPAAAALNQSFVALRGLRVDAITSSSPDAIDFVVTVNGTSKLDVRVAVDSHGLVDVLHAQPAGAVASPVPSPSTTTASGVRELAVGVGSPPLHGMLTLPRGKGPFPAVVLVSGSGPNDENETVGPNHPFLDLALGLAADGIASLRYDKRTLDDPHSVNPATFTATQEYVPDALAAIRLLRGYHTVDPRRIFVLGHSQGGTYAPLIAKEAPEVAGVIFLAAGTESIGEAILRQTRYLATLPGKTGAAAKAQLPYLEAQVAAIDDPSKLERDPPTTVLMGGAGPAYFLSMLRYHEVATAREIPQPFLFLQGDRDYQVTVANDLDVWLRGLRGRKNVTVVQFPHDDHLFLSGTGRPTPAEYSKPGHVDPKVIAAIAAWVAKIGG